MDPGFVQALHGLLVTASTEETKEITMAKESFNRYTVQQKQIPVPGWCVYGWKTMPQWSVLAGQEVKVFLSRHDTKELALAACPEAIPSNEWTEQPVSLSHLPGRNDPVAGGMYPDGL